VICTNHEVTDTLLNIIFSYFIPIRTRLSSIYRVCSCLKVRLHSKLISECIPTRFMELRTDLFKTACALRIQKYVYIINGWLYVDVFLCCVLLSFAGKHLHGGSVPRPRSLAKCLKIRCFKISSDMEQVRKR
jgi:hypothetical protein